MLLTEVATKKVNKNQAIKVRDDIAEYATDNKDDKSFVRCRYTDDGTAVSVVIAYPRYDVTAGMTGEEYVRYKQMQFADMDEFMQDCLNYIRNKHKYDMKLVDKGTNVDQTHIYKAGPIKLERFFKRPGFEIFVYFK